MIIDGKQKKAKRRFEMVLTWLGWSYMLTAVVQTAATIAMWVLNISFGADFLFASENITYTVRVVLITFAIAAASLLILSLWSEYNYKRYAKLRRRKFSGIASNEELAAHFNIETELIEQMQQSKYIELEKTIV